MAKYGISPFDNDSARFAHNCIYSRALKTISKQMEELAIRSKLEESMLGHMFILAIDLARFPTEQHKFTQEMNDEWQKLLRNYVEGNAVKSETLAKTLDVILKYFFFRNTPKGYEIGFNEIGFNEIAYLDFPERKNFIELAIDEYFEILLEYIEIALKISWFTISLCIDSATSPFYPHPSYPSHLPAALSSHPPISTREQ